jgi:predicted permease
VTSRLDRLLLRIAQLTMARADREWMIGDVEEEHARIRHELGATAARRWLAGETGRLSFDALRKRAPTFRGKHPMRHSMQDVRYAIRLLLRAPAFTAVAVLTLALGIGANTAIFSVVHGVLVKPLPYPEPDRLIRIFEESLPATPEFPVSPATFLEFRNHSQAFQAIAAHERSDLQLGGERPEQLRGMRVTAGFFEMLGYRPLLGREFTRTEEMQERGNVAILSHALWERRFASDPAVVGRSVTLSGRPFEIVGVLPPGVQHVGGSYRAYPHGESVDVWWPRQLPSIPQRRDRFQHYLSVVGRLAPGVTVAQGQDDLRRVSAKLAKEYPDSNSSWSSHVRPLRADIIGTSETTLMALLAAAGAVLLIACLNVAGLLLGRATGRTREIGVRSALGATRLRLIRQLVIESGLLSLVGGTLGVALAYATVQALLAIAPADTPRLQMVSVDRVVLAFTATATVLTALLFGLAPAIQLARADTAPSLQGGRAAPGGAQQRMRRTLVVLEVALAFVLVTTGGLLLKSFAALLRLDPGFRSDHVLTAVVNLPSARYTETAHAAAFFDRLTARVRALPGVREVGIGSDLPWTGYDENTSFGIVGRTFNKGESPEARYHFLTPGFIGALGLPLRAGRDIRASDGPKASPVVLINEQTARQYWGDAQSAIGARLNLWSETPATVVGVIGDLRDVPWAESTPGGVYFAQAQQWYPQDMIITIRTDADPMSLVGPLMQAVRDLDPELPLAGVRTLDDIAGAALATRRFTLALVAAFALSALFLAVVGVYGVMAQAVGQRVREFGVRQALGAKPSDILQLVLSGGAVMGLVGLLAGVAVALPTTRLVQSLLYRTDPADPMTLASVAVVLLAATLAASYVPARRATKTDPASALRRE